MNKAGLKCEVIKNVNAAKDGFRTRVVDYYEFLMPFNGSCRISVNGSGFELKQDEFAVIMPDEAFRFVKADLNTQVAVVKLYPQVTGLDNEAKSLFAYLKEKSVAENAHVYSFPAEKWGLARDCMVRICHGELDENSGWQFAYLAAMLFEIKSYGEPVAALDPSNEFVDRDLPSFNKAVEYISENLTTLNNLTALERGIGIKNTAINRIFRKMTGTSTWNYIIRKRLDYACDLMLDGKRTIDASKACGFKDYSVFYRMFMNTYGIAPTSIKKTGCKPMRLDPTDEE